MIKLHFIFDFPLYVHTIFLVHKILIIYKYVFQSYFSLASID